jgi:soluble lytic murein transglycosylase-like protein
MMRPSPRLLVAAASALLVSVVSAGTAHAELVFLSSGRTLSVKSHRFEGDSIVLTLRAGGQITCDATLVERIEPDEVPYPEPELAASAADPSLPYSDMIATAATRAGIDPRLVHAVIRVESAYQAQARSRKGAMGLMQLMPETARQYAVGNPYDPGANIEAGTRHLKSLIDRLADLPLALAAYNAGEAAVQRFGGIPPYPETQNYVRQVMRLAGVAR